MKKVLIVDDEEGIVNMIKMIMENAGYETITANNGREGVAIAEKQRPDIIISDILMPEMDGYEFYKEIKKNKKTSKIPFVVLTARGQMEDSLKAIGVDDFVEKPSEGGELLSKVETLLKRRMSGRPITLYKRILLAGGYKNILDDMALQLKREKYEVKIVNNGDEVIEEAINFKPNVLLLEVTMTVISSEEIIRILKLMPKLSDLSILMYSYYELSDLGSEVIQKEILQTESIQKRCIDMGADTYIGRYNSKALLKLLHPYLK